MGDDNRIASVRQGPESSVWRNQPIGGSGVGPVVKHTFGDATVSVQFLDQEVRVPLVQTRWLAEVLLSLTDQYREMFAVPVEDNSGPGPDDDTAGV